MTTKKNKHINNKTKKNKKLLIPTSILDIYNKNVSISTNEKKLACFLANNDKIKLFTFKVFYYILKYWKTNYKSKWTSIIKNSIVQDINDKTISKIGFTKDETNIIFNLVNNNDKKELFDYLDDKFFKVTSSLNSLVEPQFTIYHIERNKNLQKIFIKQLEKLMLIKDISWKDINKIYNSLKNDKERNMYNFFMFDIIYSADKNVDSIYRNNLGNMNFFRERLNDFKHIKSNYIKVNECNKSVISDNDYSKYGIYNSTERYKINIKSPYYKIMKKYNSPFIGGPSGSTSLMYIMLFHFYMYPFTYKNKIMLMGMLIADYIPLWHSIPEILLSAYHEFEDKKIPKYTLNENSVLYSVNLLKKIIE